MEPKPATGDFHGLPTRSLSNDHLSLDYLAEAGPRIVRLFAFGSRENLLAEVPALSWETPHGPYFPRGGHRLWQAPESLARSCVPDDTGLTIEETGDAVRLRQPVEAPTGIAKSIEIRLLPDRPAVRLDHRLENRGARTVELAPWAITQLRTGGRVVLPQQTEALDGDGLRPNRHLVLWPYSRWDDPRLHLHDKLLVLDSRPFDSPIKLGYLNRHGWTGYVCGDVFFCKRFEPQPERLHADMNCNVEAYANGLFVELETLGPLCRLEPGAFVVHTEAWELHRLPRAPQSPAEAREAVWALDLSRRRSE